MTITDWKGYKQINFTVGGRKSYFVCPEKPLAGNPWVWRTEFFGAFDSVDRALLEKGWYLAYHCVSNMYGCPQSIDLMREFYDVAVNEYGMSKTPVLFGFSRGGLYAVNFAARFPESCSALYLDAPVLDIRSWPAGWGVGIGGGACWDECKKWYNLTDESAKVFDKNPIDYAKKNAADGLPVIIVAGGVDKTVPYIENGAVYYERYKAVSDKIKTIVKPDCDHHPHSLSDPAPVVEFIEEYCKK